ncbi:MAG: ADP-forming succinate--CoA ligase subunit beta, partial [Planctomycetes bacterium]|nr:ADP-forming succinate--CoA ligase subunit beta [Planctomycetota bacterium]
MRRLTIKLHEYQARELLRDYAIAVPDGTVARTADDAAKAAAKWDGAVVVKGQVLTGGRGKAGAIKVVSSVQEARAAAEKIIGMTVKDLPVNAVLITERINIASEYYLGITIDREAESVVLILSAAGGMDIEEVAATEPEKIRRLTLTANPSPESLKAWLADSFPDLGHLEQALPIIVAMNKLFREKDCSLVEINPLAITAEGKLVAADAKVVLDDNAVPFHPGLAELRNDEEYTPDEIEANGAGLSFVSLEGKIGCMVNGAGLAMATMDLIKLHGGEPANFLDVGGGATPKRVAAAFKLILSNPAVSAILVNIFG